MGQQYSMQGRMADEIQSYLKKKNFIEGTKPPLFLRQFYQ